MAEGEGRYDRHGLIDWFDQELVKGLRVIVIGAGAVGNEVIKNLVLLGVGRIDIFDFDLIGLSIPITVPSGFHGLITLNFTSTAGSVTPIVITAQ